MPPTSSGSTFRVASTLRPEDCSIRPTIEAASIVAQIEQSSGRKVEATRKVDPELVGGMILQAGSLRVDASVRGRLQRLRHELATTR